MADKIRLRYLAQKEETLDALTPDGSRHLCLLIASTHRLTYVP